MFHTLAGVGTRVAVGYGKEETGDEETRSEEGQEQGPRAKARGRRKREKA